MAQPHRMPQGGLAPKRRRVMDGSQNLLLSKQGHFQPPLRGFNQPMGFSQPVASNQRMGFNQQMGSNLPMGFDQSMSFHQQTGSNQQMGFSQQMSFDQGAFAQGQAPQNTFPAYTGTGPLAHSFHANQNSHFSPNLFAQGSQNTIPQDYPSEYADTGLYQSTGAPAAGFTGEQVPTGDFYPEAPLAPAPALGLTESQTRSILQAATQDLWNAYPDLSQQAPLPQDQAPFPSQQGPPNQSYTDLVNEIPNTWDHPNESGNSDSAELFTPGVNQQAGAEKQPQKPLEGGWDFIDDPNLTFEVKRDRFRQIPDYRQDPVPKKGAGRNKKPQRFWAPPNANAAVKQKYASLQGADENVKGAEDKLAKTENAKRIVSRQKTVLRNMKLRQILWGECERLEQGLPAQEMSLEEAEARWRKDLHIYEVQSGRYWQRRRELTAAHPEILRDGINIDMPKLGGIDIKTRLGFQTMINWKIRAWVKLKESYGNLWAAQDRRFGSVSIKADIFSRVLRMHEVGGVETWADITWPGNSPLHQKLRAEFTNLFEDWTMHGPWHDRVANVGGDGQQAQPENTETGPGIEQPAVVLIDAQENQGQEDNVTTPATTVWGTSEAPYANDGPQPRPEDDPDAWLKMNHLLEQVDPALDWDTNVANWNAADAGAAAEAFEKQREEAERTAEIYWRVQTELAEANRGLEQPAIVSVDAREDQGQEAEVVTPATAGLGALESPFASDDLEEIDFDAATREIEAYNEQDPDSADGDAVVGG